MRAVFLLGRSMDLEFINGRMGRFMKGGMLRIGRKGMGSLQIVRERNFRGSGRVGGGRVEEC